MKFTKLCLLCEPIGLLSQIRRTKPPILEGTWRVVYLLRPDLVYHATAFKSTSKLPKITGLFLYNITYSDKKSSRRGVKISTNFPFFKQTAP